LKHKRRTRRRAKEDYRYTCAWCRTTIPERHEHFGFGAKATADVDLSEFEGKWIDIQLVSAGKTVQVESQPQILLPEESRDITSIS
jgi:hypothetical protein